MPRTSDKLYGLYVFGTIKDRRKRVFEKDGNTIEIITYDVADNEGHIHYVEAYEPEKYYERAEYVQIPVYIKAYKKKNGEPAYVINVKGNNAKNIKGESF